MELNMNSTLKLGVLIFFAYLMEEGGRRVGVKESTLNFLGDQLL